jgi:NAD(P)-dependent dehydrogenase (short-subunit alcohol dehydrogenase family)
MMDGKTCMVTGANRGIGKATAIGLAKLGANVVMVCRDPDRGNAARDAVIQASNNESINLMLADLSSQSSIRHMAQEFLDKYPQLHVLVNNAGTYRTRRTLTEDGIEIHFAVNYLAPFLLTNLLIEALKAGTPSRVVNLVGIYHRKATLNFDDPAAWRAQE